MFAFPIESRLANSRRVLIAGAGGGFDVFSGLPLFFSLRNRGVDVFLANYSFTALAETDAHPRENELYEVKGSSTSPLPYFPEKHLAAFLEERDYARPIYAIEKLGLEQLTAAYAELVESLGINTIVIVDGGTDSLMRGDEVSLGTPAEDIATLLAAEATGLENQLLVCLGFGIDRYHGICHADFLEAVSELTSSGGFLGAFALQREMPEVQAYYEATEYTQARTPNRESIVSASILSALDGSYGNVHRLARTRPSGSELWINPLMTFYWAFDLLQVSRRVLYRDWLEGTRSFGEMCMRIEAFRDGVDVRQRRSIPV